MENPFLKRASEHLREVDAFLAVVSPEPVRTFLAVHGQNGTLFDRLVLMRGTPGSGKTTLARLFEYATLTALLRKSDIGSYRHMVAALTDCGALQNLRPAILACRLNMETDYRRIWDFPYSDDLKLGLTVALAQARSVLAWMRNLRQSGVQLSQVVVRPKSSASAAGEAIGAPTAADVLNRARDVETSVYRIVAALIPVAVQELPTAILSAYQPFDVIEGFEIDGELALRPLVILDDANVLHPNQLQMLQRWLTRRELPVSRWVLSRLDIMHLDEALAAFSDPGGPDLPGVTAERDTLEIMLQSLGEDRRQFRSQFRKMARDMADRYLAQMPLFNSRGLESLADLLQNEAEPLPSSKQKQMAASAENTQQRLSISGRRRQLIKDETARFRPHGKDLPADLQLSMESILLFRYANRVPQKGLFETHEDFEPSRPLKVDSGVYEGARLHLLHGFDRSYYYGMDTLCDAGSENAEQFLHLAAPLVEALATRVIRGRSAQLTLDAKTQNDLLRDKADDIMRHWDFPLCQRVSQLVDRIAQRCLDESLEPNAWLGAGANAYGVLQEEFNNLAQSFPDLGKAIHFGLAYNAFFLVPRYPCKGQVWCLLELGGIPILKYGLTLRRGGFIEGSLSDLQAMTERK